MPGPVSKRRKLDRSQGNNNGVDTVPLASSGSTKASTGSETVDFDKAVVKDNGIETGGKVEFALEESEQEPQVKGVRLSGTNIAKRRSNAGQRTAQAQYLGGAYAGEIYKSNIFKLQVDELLSQVKPNFSRIESSIASLLRTVKNIIEAIPDREPVSVSSILRPHHIAQKPITCRT
jgi:U3 small nucleolar RNA-associated protein 22